MKQKYLPDLCAGRLIAVNAMTEPQPDPIHSGWRLARNAKATAIVSGNARCSAPTVRSQTLR